MNKHTAVAPDNSKVFTRNSKTALYTHIAVIQENGEWFPISWHKSQDAAAKSKREWEASKYVVGIPCAILEVEVA